MAPESRGHRRFWDLAPWAFGRVRDPGYDRPMLTRTRITACFTLVVLLTGSTASAAPAKGGGALRGTISWTSTKTTETDTPGGDAFTQKETRTVTLKVKMTKRAGAMGWQPEDNGSSYTGRYALTSTRLERSVDGVVSCTTTHVASGSASGALSKKPRTTSAPSLFGSVLPSTASLGAQTKAIVLRPILRYKGKDTVTTTGSGISPCQSGQDIDPIEGSLTPTDDARQICYPAGTSTRTTTPRAGIVLGAWKSKSRKFAFTCSDTFTGGDDEKVVLRVSGTLALK